MSIPGSALALLGSGAGVADYTIERSLRFDSSASSYLSKTPTSAGNRRTWTWSGWVKRSGLGNEVIFSAQGASTHTLFTFYASTAKFAVVPNAGSAGATFQSNGVFRDTSAWYHFVIALDTTQSTSTDRFKVYVNGAELTWSSSSYPAQNEEWNINVAGAHNIGRATQVNSYLDGYLADVHFIDGQALAATDFGEPDADTGVWNPKAYSGTYGTNGFHLDFSDNSNALALGYDAAGSNDWTLNNISVGTGNGNYLSTSYTNESSIYPTENSFDGDFSTRTGGDTNAYSVYTFSSGISYTSQVRIYGDIDTRVGTNGDIKANSTSVTGVTDGIGLNGANKKWYTVLTGSGTLNSVSIKSVSGTYWAFIYAIEVDGVVLVDNSFTSENDSLIDTPTNYEADSGNNGGNYCTLNPLANGGTATISNGNLEISAATTGSNKEYYSTIGMTSGKWYAEFTLTGTRCLAGISNEFVFSSYFGSQSSQYGYHHSGSTYNGGTATAYGDSLTTGDVLGIAFDADGGNLYFYKNGVAQNSGTAAYTGLTSGPYFYGGGESGATGHWNFGQRPFAYTPPTGFKSLCTTNLPTPTIADGSDYFDVKTYTGNDNTQTITGMSLQPDLLWLKSRAQATNHELVDSVRGSSKYLFSNLPNAEVTDTARVTSFNSDGFSIGANSNANVSGGAVAWAWKAGSTFTPTVSGFTSPSGRRNTTAGFSIVKVTGNNTVSSFDHGLGVAPALIISKNLDNAYDWGVYHEAVEAAPTQKFLNLNDTGAVASKSGNIYRVVSSSSVEVDSYAETGSSGDYVYYCFAPVEGYSAFGSYTGNGSADGPFLYTGFRVAWLLTKRTDGGANNWQLIDATRSPSNVADVALKPDENSSETTSADYSVDFLSNGFKHRTGHIARNGSGNTYIYAAFAEHPFKTARAR